jgi:PAS domain-containing protein
VARRPRRSSARPPRRSWGPTSPPIAQRTQKVFDHGETATYERLTTLPGLGARHLHVKAVPDLDESAPRAACTSWRDITEVKEAEAQLAAREQDLRFFAENIPRRSCTSTSSAAARS